MQQPESTQRRRWPIALLAVAAIGLIFGCGGFGAWYRLTAPQPWPSGEIAYYNATDWGPTLKAAVLQWNRLDFGVRFAETDDPERAQLLIVQRRRIDCDYCVGRTSRIGYSDRPVVVKLFPPAQRDEPGQVNDTYVTTMVHELGHVLGLQHVQANCAVMKSKSSDKCLPAVRGIDGKYTRVVCGPFERDLKQLAALYGIDPPSALPYCYERRWAATNVLPEPYVEILKEIADKDQGTNADG